MKKEWNNPIVTKMLLKETTQDCNIVEEEIDDPENPRLRKKIKVWHCLTHNVYLYSKAEREAHWNTDTIHTIVRS